MGLHRPLLPFLVVFISPALTVPLTMVILVALPSRCVIGDSSVWGLRDVQLVLLLELVDLFPLMWRRSPVARVRRAASVAGLVGAARLVFSQLAIVFTSVFTSVLTVSAGGKGTCPEGGAYVVPLIFLFITGTVILGFWLVSAIIGVGLYWLNGRSEGRG